MFISKNTSIQKTRINRQIRAQKLRVVDDEGNMVGILSLDDALALAEDKGLDLVEISPKADPPVAKILSFDKYRYQQEKAAKEQRKRQKKVDVKGIRLSLRIGEHDLKFKAKQADKFLKNGDKVKIDMLLRGRERANVDFAFEVFDKFLQTIEEAYLVEQKAKKAGHVITAVIAPESQ